MNPTIIEDIKARKILDSRGNWTIEVDIVTRCGYGRACAPSGASTGKYEVMAFPDGDVDKAVIELEEIVIPELIGMDSEEQEVVDDILKELDGTDNFSNIGGNATIAISLASAKAAASSYALPLYQYLGGNLTVELPYPLGNVIGGGAHAKNATDIQEFQVIPIGAKNITEALFANSQVHKKLKELLAKKVEGFVGGKGDEGAWAVGLRDEEALDTLNAACEEVKESTGVDIKIGVDVAASELWDESKNKYVYTKGGRELDSGEQIEYMRELIERYNIYYAEDPIMEEDFDSFKELTSKVDCLICGDDLYVTNTERIKRGIEKGATNSVLIKPNQIGTLTDTYRAVKLTKNYNLTPVMSHRSGETTDETIAHLAVGFNCPLIKTGVVGGARIAKLNELLRIGEELAQRARMAQLPI
ncbi:MAG: phosphopyruvate hydratase [Candidatus Hydrothermarchaeales archaeon]